jgi:hypothetical protein
MVQAILDLHLGGVLIRTSYVLRISVIEFEFCSCLADRGIKAICYTSKYICMYIYIEILLASHSIE